MFPNSNLAGAKGLHQENHILTFVLRALRGLFHGPFQGDSEGGIAGS
jgi:hypothetical protein